MSQKRLTALGDARRRIAILLTASVVFIYFGFIGLIAYRRDILARVIAPGGHLLHLPIHPSLIGVLLEIMFRFKSHSPEAVKEQTEKHFRIVHQYRFAKQEPIGWSKTAILAQKL